MINPPKNVRFITTKRVIAVAAIGALAATLTACAPGASDSQSASAPTEALTGVGDGDITLTLTEAAAEVPYFEALGAAFTKKYPNVTVEVSGQDFQTLVNNAPRLISGTNVPDLIRLASFGKVVEDKLVTNLDGYAEAYGWDEWPQAQFDSTRSNDKGTQRGTGSLYGAGPGFGLTGIYVNRDLAEQLGSDGAPATLEELESLMEKAKGAGKTPMIISGPAATLSNATQNLLIDYADSTETVQAWNYNEPGASIDDENTVKAAAKLQEWADAGYFPTDVSSLQQADAVSEFTAGDALFYVSGNWDAPAIDKAASGSFGFIAFPALEEGGTTAAMSASDLQVIPTKAAHPREAAAFLDFVQTDPEARQITVDLGGYVPGGPADGSTPTTAEGSAVGDTVATFADLSSKDQLVEFMLNATGSMAASTLIPQTELLVANKTTPEEFSAKVQSDYVSQLSN